MFFNFSINIVLLVFELILISKDLSNLANSALVFSLISPYLNNNNNNNTLVLVIHLTNETNKQERKVKSKKGKKLFCL